MKISEMSLEQLQDYAVKLEEENKGLGDRCEAYEKEKSDLLDLNKQLQKRNNDLFLKVEQQGAGEEAPQPKPEKVDSCEDFARKLFKEGKI